MSEQLISRRGAFSLLGLAVAAGFAVPTTMLTTSDAEAQAQPRREARRGMYMQSNKPIKQPQ